MQAGARDPVTSDGKKKDSVSDLVLMVSLWMDLKYFRVCQIQQIRSPLMKDVHSCANHLEMLNRTLEDGRGRDKE